MGNKELKVSGIVKNKRGLVTKISASPTRSVNLGEKKGWTTLSAGVELKLDPPVKIGSKELEEAWDELRKMIKEEFARQYAPYKEMLEKGGDVNAS